MPTDVATDGEGRSRPGRDRRRRRRRDQHRLPPHEARVERRPAPRALRAHERLDVPFGGARRPAAELGEPHADDDVRGRAVPEARSGDRRRPRMAPGRDAAPRVLALPARGARPAGGLGQELRSARRDRLGPGGARTVPAARRLERAGGAVRPDGRPPGSHRADDGLRRGRQARRREDPHRRPRAGGRGPRRPGDRRRHRPRRDRGRGRRERRRDLGARARAARRRRDPRGADGAPVPDHAADRGRHGELPDPARPRQPRVRPRGGRRSGGRRVRAQPGPLARRHADPARLQPPAAPGEVGAVRADRGGCVQPDPRAAHDRDQPLHQRSRGVHARRRLHPGRDRGPGLLRGGGLLRPRHHRRGRRRPVHRRMDRRRRAVDGPVEDGRPAVRGALPEPAVRARARPRDLREALRREVPGRGLPGGPAAQGLAHLRAARGARRRVRREGRLGARELVPLERGSRVRLAAAPRVGRRALVDRDRGRARRDARARGPVRRVELRQARGLGPGSVRVPPADLRERCRRGGRPRRLHADAQPTRRNPVRPHGDPPVAGALPDRDRHGLGQPRSRVDHLAARRRRTRRRPRRDLELRRASACGVRAPGTSCRPCARTICPTRAFRS